MWEYGALSETPTRHWCHYGTRREATFSSWNGSVPCCHPVWVCLMAQKCSSSPRWRIFMVLENMWWGMLNVGLTLSGPKSILQHDNSPKQSAGVIKIYFLMQEEQRVLRWNRCCRPQRALISTSWSHSGVKCRNRRHQSSLSPQRSNVKFSNMHI